MKRELIINVRRKVGGRDDFYAALLLSVERSGLLAPAMGSGPCVTYKLAMQLTSDHQVRPLRGWIIDWITFH